MSSCKNLSNNTKKTNNNMNFKFNSSWLNSQIIKSSYRSYGVNASNSKVNSKPNSTVSNNKITNNYNKWWRWWTKSCVASEEANETGQTEIFNSTANNATNMKKRSNIIVCKIQNWFKLSNNWNCKNKNWKIGEKCMRNRKKWWWGS